MAAQEEPIITQLSDRHGLPEDAVRTLLEALRRSGGAMAQFDHPALGGTGQWSGGMIMIGDMFNDQLKAKVAALAADLSTFVRGNPEARAPERKLDAGSWSSGRASQDWWPHDLGTPSSAGSQNSMRYAVFPDRQRLAVDDHGTVTVYDTADHQIGGAGQQQGGGSTLTFTSQHGTIRLADLKQVG